MTFRTCSVDGCGRDVLALGYCSPHYKRVRAGTGDLTTPIRYKAGSTTFRESRLAADRRYKDGHRTELALRAAGRRARKPQTAEQRQAAAARTAAWRKANPDRRRVHDDRRNARVRGSQMLDPVLRAAVFARDGGECHICGGMTVPRSADKGERPSLDHLMPVSRGGEHTMDNLATAHVSCNARRGNRVPVYVAVT